MHKEITVIVFSGTIEMPVFVKLALASQIDSGSGLKESLYVFCIFHK